MAKNTRVLYPLPWGDDSLGDLGPFPLRVTLGRRASHALFGERENLRARTSALAHFFVACLWARRLRGDRVDHIHSQWAYSSGSIGMYGAWLLGVSFSFTGHASDLFRDRVAPCDKIRCADFIICISEFHRAFFLENGARPEQLHVAYCGIYVNEMVPCEGQRPPRPYTILSAGRLVEKKGFEYLIDACEILQGHGRVFRCVIAGSGPLEEALRERIAKVGLGQHVEVTGKALSQESIPAFVYGGDVFALACVWAKDGDVDGLPQLTMEAMACGAPAITTRLVGNPDLVVHERTGLLVEVRNAAELARAIERLMEDPALAATLAANGRQWILECFDIRTSLEPISQYRRRLSTGASRDRRHARRAQWRPRLDHLADTLPRQLRRRWHRPSGVLPQ